MLGALALPSCEAPEQAKTLGAGPNNAPTPAKQMEDKPTSFDLKGTLVFQRGDGLEAIEPGQKNPVVLRDTFSASNWNLSRDGGRLVFAGLPADVHLQEPLDARSFVFEASWNRRQKVALSAYGPHHTEDSYSFSYPSWTSDGKKLVVCEQLDGLAALPSEIAVYNFKTRKEVWSSRLITRSFLSSQSPLHDEADQWKSFYAPAISPDGKDLICFAVLAPLGTETFNAINGDRQPVVSLVHIDLKRCEGEVLASTSGASSIRQFENEIAWHPTQKKFLFVGATTPTGIMRSLYLLDLKARRTTPVSQSEHIDSSPQWSLDGKAILWVRDGRIWRANADGSGARAILPQIQGVTKIQLLPHIADWGRYRKLSIEPLAGKDK